MAIDGFGSINNLLLSGTNGEPEPVVGMGATILMYSDRHAASIIRVEKFKSGPHKGEPRSIFVQEDAFVRTDANGMSESQSYAFSADPKGRVSEFSVRYGGDRKRWVEKDGTNRLRIGEREKYHDFSF